MTEVYERPSTGNYDELLSRAPAPAIAMQGRATYSNFRRFQVKTEEKIAIPK